MHKCFSERIVKIVINNGKLMKAVFVLKKLHKFISHFTIHQKLSDP